MDIKVNAKIDESLSVDPSYIVRYQVFEQGHFIGDGVVQFHREAKSNDLIIPDTIKHLNGRPLSEKDKKMISTEIAGAVWPKLQTLL